nr:hypothetical protein Iba_chr05dCG19170 [Ipomoea batatas]GMD02451.1 hypothetical protein Iba_chr05fCG16760 [Ipomoea batatas]
MSQARVTVSSPVARSTPVPSKAQLVAVFSAGENSSATIEVATASGSTLEYSRNCAGICSPFAVLSLNKLYSFKELITFLMSEILMCFAMHPHISQVVDPWLTNHFSAHA